MTTTRERCVTCQVPLDDLPEGLGIVVCHRCEGYVCEPCALLVWGDLDRTHPLAMIWECRSCSRKPVQLELVYDSDPF